MLHVQTSLLKVAYVTYCNNRFSLLSWYILKFLYLIINNIFFKKLLVIYTILNCVQYYTYSFFFILYRSFRPFPEPILLSKGLNKNK